MPNPPPDWQLPPGVSRGLWHYLHNDAIAQDYDASLGAASLVTVDRQFVEAHCRPPGRLIDLGCGTGRLLVPLAARGYRVVGVDLSAPMLRVASAKAAAAVVHVDLVQANFVDLGCLDDASFDYAVCLFSTLGMVSGREHRGRVLDHAYRLLRPGGLLVLHVHNRWFNFWDRTGRQWLLGDLVKTALGRDTAGDRSMPAYGEMPALTLHLFTRREVLRLLRRTGFNIVEVRPVSLGEDGKLRWPRWFGWLRAYGYLIAAAKPLAA
jgi:ubiquinone/menaquinone biosynthesis C-methylase UbiE